MRTCFSAFVVRACWQSRKGAMSSTITVSKAFRGQLQSLMATLHATEPHYIKCIKPNNVKAPGGFRCEEG